MTEGLVAVGQNERPTFRQVNFYAVNEFNLLPFAVQLSQPHHLSFATPWARDAPVHHMNLRTNLRPEFAKRGVVLRQHLQNMGDCIHRIENGLESGENISSLSISHKAHVGPTGI